MSGDSARSPATDRVVDGLASVLAGWDESVAVGLLESGDDRYDPYFHLSFDVYLRGDLRTPRTRERAFGDVGAFENSLLTHKDRFLVGEIPVRIEYKQAHRFVQLVGAARFGENQLRDSGSYTFRRIVDARILGSRDRWMESLRDQLSSLPTEFWSQLRVAQQGSAEHLYGDLQAAAAREDEFYFTVCAGRFLTRLCSFLFAVNRRFEPSPHMLAHEVLALHALPLSFGANLEHFVGSAHHLSLVQRTELAEMMITGALSL